MCWQPSGAANLPSTDVLRAVFPDYKEERVAVQSAPPPKEEGWLSLRNAAGMLFKLPGTRPEPKKPAKPMQKRRAGARRGQ